MSTGARTRAVWSDFGGVLTPPVAVTLRRYCADISVPVDAFQAALRTVAASYGLEDVMAPLDTPLIDQRSWERQVERALADVGVTTDLTDFPRRWFADRAVNGEWISQLRALRGRGVFIGMLSNMPPSWDFHWREIVPDGLFDDVILSFEVGCRKPDFEIFRLAAQRADVAPEDCILVDDLYTNCLGARVARWQAVEFRTANAAGHAVESLLGDPSSGIQPLKTGTQHR